MDWLIKECGRKEGFVGLMRAYHAVMLIIGIAVGTCDRVPFPVFGTAPRVAMC